MAIVGSSITTTGFALSAASLEPVVSWVLNGFSHPIPENVPLLIAAALISASHAVYNLGQMLIEKYSDKVSPSSPTKGE